MDKINFVNGSQPAINDINLNQMQTNIEEEINNTIQTVTNANGTATKFADGTMICRGTRVVTNLNFTQQWGSLYETTTHVDLGVFPVNFVEKPNITISCVHSDGAVTFIPEKLEHTSGTIIGLIYLARPVSSENVSVCIDYIAVGRWK